VNNYRVIVVGGGGAGIPFAVRLAKSAGVDVLLLEAGPGWRGPAEAPAPYSAHLSDASTVAHAMPGGPLAWTYQTRLFPGRDHRIARGRLLGGSTAINGAYFMRAHPDDFSGWAETAGSEWTYDSALPALRRLERDLDFPTDALHGAEGPVPVARPSADDAITRGFLDASSVSGYPLIPDKNGDGQPGVGRLPLNVHGGKRWGTAAAYLAGNFVTGLTIRGNAAVHRLLFKGTRAVGVEIHEGGTLRREYADEIVIGAGAIETPRLLMRSGVGSARASRSGGAEVVVDLPGVGQGLSDHPAVMIDWMPYEIAVNRHSAVSWTAALNFSAPGGSERGDLELLLAIMPNTHIVSGEFAYGPISLRVALQTPESRGIVHPERAPSDVEYRYLESVDDRAGLRHGIREALQLLSSRAFADVAAEVHAPVAALLVDDDSADDWIRTRLSTSLHASGTARMGPEGDPLAVTDPHGRVHGVERLRVIDTSLLPTVPSRGTAAAAVFLGERLAELWLSEPQG
jgi:choline dehydrogenase